jgi:hypothetical protein
MENEKQVAWLLTDKNINSLQVQSIQRLIDRARHAHHTDICLRINGQDEWHQADWLKHLVMALRERSEMMDFIEEFTGAERERHPMFSEGYDLALLHMKQFLEGRS